MSAGPTAFAGIATTQPQPSRDMDLLAPAFRDAVDAAIRECNANGLDAFVYEGYRSMELQGIYWARGRTVTPPFETVTNAKSNLYSWHGFGLAVDVISKSKLWDAGAAWFARVAAIFKKYGCDWGGDWRRVDLPHMYWGTLRPTPSDRARSLLASGGLQAVWKEVGALGSGLVVLRVRVLTLGMVGDDVKEMQAALGARATGVFDELTDAWVRGFQRGSGIAVDGDVGKLTRAKLGL